jgi:hypothetical protein
MKHKEVFILSALIFLNGQKTKFKILSRKNWLNIRLFPLKYSDPQGRAFGGLTYGVGGCHVGDN